MNALRSFLRYEFRLPVGRLLAIVATVLLVNAFWHNPPTWIFFLLGAVIVVIEDHWRALPLRWVRRRA